MSNPPVQPEPSSEDDGSGRTGGFCRAGTEPAAGVWPATGGEFLRSEVSAVIGSGDAAFEQAADEVLRWVVKTRSGFRVDDDSVVVPGRRTTVTARVLGVTVIEPVEVFDVVQTADRVGFSYQTLPGHPVDGEEAFVVHRTGAVVRLTIRSLTRASGTQPWRALFPVLRVAQVVARRRYLRALSTL